MKASTSTKLRRDILTLRIPAAELNLIDRAASSIGQTRTDFILGAARRAAEDILLDRAILSVGAKTYAEFIKAFHVKDAEFRPNGRSGVYGGYQGWVDRPGRFRSLGDGQIDFKAIFSKLAEYDYPGWAVLEWECALKHPEDGAREGAPFIRDHIIRVTPHAFDDFAASGVDAATNTRLLGL